MMITYRNGNWDETTMDAAIAPLDEVSVAYTYLLDKGFTGDFPGSRACAAAKVYRDQLAELVLARPEIEEYRAGVAAARRADLLAGKDILGM